MPLIVTPESVGDYLSAERGGANIQLWLNEEKYRESDYLSTVNVSVTVFTRAQYPGYAVYIVFWGLHVHKHHILISGTGISLDPGFEKPGLAT